MSRTRSGWAIFAITCGLTLTALTAEGQILPRQSATKTAPVFGMRYAAPNGYAPNGYPQMAQAAPGVVQRMVQGLAPGMAPRMQVAQPMPNMRGVPAQAMMRQVAPMQGMPSQAAPVAQVAQQFAPMAAATGYPGTQPPQTLPPEGAIYINGKMVPPEQAQAWLQQSWKPGEQPIPSPADVAASPAYEGLPTSAAYGLQSKAKIDADVAALVAMAVKYEQARNVNAAVACYHQALELDSTDYHTLVSFARLKHRIGDLDGAIVTYEQVLKHNPGNAVALNDLGLVYARQGNNEIAVESLKAAIDNKPSSKRYRNNLATVYVEMDMIEPAVEAIVPGSGEALARLYVANLLKNRRRGEEASMQLAQALRVDPSLTPARLMLAEISKPAAMRANRLMHIPGKVANGLTAPSSAAAISTASTTNGVAPNIKLQSAEIEEDAVTEVFHADHYEILETIKKRPMPPVPGRLPK